jgi:hypothetical protein
LILIGLPSLEVPGLAEKRPSVLVGTPDNLPQHPSLTYIPLQGTEFSYKRKALSTGIGLKAVYTRCVKRKLDFASMDRLFGPNASVITCVTVSNSIASLYGGNIKAWTPDLLNRESCSPPKNI